MVVQYSCMDSVPRLSSLLLDLPSSVTLGPLCQKQRCNLSLRGINNVVLPNRQVDNEAGGSEADAA